MFKQVTDFNTNITRATNTSSKPGPIRSKKEMDWCCEVVREELDEFIDAFDNHDFIGQVDAAMDLIYFASGFLNRMGLPPEVSKEIFDHIHSCNMMKDHGAKTERGVHINTDATKPKGWVGPEEGIAKILTHHYGK